MKTTILFAITKNAPMIMQFFSVILILAIVYLGIVVSGSTTSCVSAAGLVSNRTEQQQSLTDASHDDYGRAVPAFARLDAIRGGDRRCHA